MTLRHLRAGAVTLVLIGGLPGTGKSALAGAAAGRLGFTVLNSDRIRKELAGLPAETSARTPYGGGIYTAGWTERTYRELHGRAAVLLAHGESVDRALEVIRPHGPEHIWRPGRPYMLPG